MELNDPDSGDMPAGAGAPLVAPDGQVFVREVSGGLRLPITTLRHRANPLCRCMRARDVIRGLGNEVAGGWRPVLQAAHICGAETVDI